MRKRRISQVTTMSDNSAKEETRLNSAGLAYLTEEEKMYINLQIEAKKVAIPIPPEERTVVNEDGDIPFEDTVDYAELDRPGVLTVTADYLKNIRKVKRDQPHRYWEYAYEKPWFVEPKQNNQFYEIVLGDRNVREYSADEIDEKLIERLNKTTYIKDVELTKELYELMFTRLDRASLQQCFIKEKRSGVFFLRPKPFHNECTICGTDDTYDDNRLIECHVCHMVAHQDCYGVPFRPAVPWLCKSCCSVPYHRPRCFICPLEHGPLKQTTSSEFVHMPCAMWTAGVSVSMSQYREPIDVECVNRPLECCLCRLSYGALVKCNQNCQAQFHLSCAEAAGCTIKVTLRGDGFNIKREVNCPIHSNLKKIDAPRTVLDKLKAKTPFREAMIFELQGYAKIMNPHKIKIPKEVIDVVYYNYIRRRVANNGNLLCTRLADLSTRVYRIRAVELQSGQLAPDTPDEFRFHDENNCAPNRLYDIVDDWHILPTNLSTMYTVRSSIFIAESRDSFFSLFYNMIISTHRMKLLQYLPWQVYMPLTSDPLHATQPFIQVHDFIGFVSLCVMPVDLLIGIFIAGLIYLDEQGLFFAVNTNAEKPMNLTIIYEKYLSQKYKILHQVYDDFDRMMTLLSKTTLSKEHATYVKRFEEAACFLIISPTYLQGFHLVRAQLGIKNKDVHRLVYYFISKTYPAFELPERKDKKDDIKALSILAEYVYKACEAEKKFPQSLYYMIKKLSNRRTKPSNKNANDVPFPTITFSMAFPLRFLALRGYFMNPENSVQYKNVSYADRVLAKNVKDFGFEITENPIKMIIKEPLRYSLETGTGMDSFDIKEVTLDDRLRDTTQDCNDSPLFHEHCVRPFNFGHNTLVIVKKCSIGEQIAGRAIHSSRYKKQYNKLQRVYKRGRVLVHFSVKTVDETDQSINSKEFLESVRWDHVAVLVPLDAKIYLDKYKEHLNSSLTLQSISSVLDWYDLNRTGTAMNDFAKNDTLSVTETEQSANPDVEMAEVDDGSI